MTRAVRAGVGETVASVMARMMMVARWMSSGRPPGRIAARRRAGSSAAESITATLIDRTAGRAAGRATRTVTVATGALGSLVAGVLAAVPASAATDTPLTLAKGARVAVISLLDPEVTHFHAARQLKDSFLKTQTVAWPVDSMLTDAVKDRLTQMGLSPVPLPMTEGLARSREDCFLNANLNKGLPRECNQQFEQLASSQHVDALIVLAPGLNNSAHAGNARHKDLPDYLRGWGFVTSETGPSDKPMLFSDTELVLIDPTPTGVALRGREWGGYYSLQWLSYVPPPDPKSIPLQELDQLQPLFADLLSRQVNRLLDQLRVMP